MNPRQWPPLDRTWPLKLALILAAFMANAEARGQLAEAELDPDIVYSRVDEGPLRLDLMVPGQGDGPYPVVIVIHGGAWRRGDKIECRAIMLRLAEQGFATVAPQFRLAPENPFPASLIDLKKTVRWIKSNAKARLLDGGHIGVYGANAGGHLALMLGATSEEDGLEGPITPGQPDSRVQAVVTYFGQTDLADPDFSPTSKQLITDFIGGDPSKNPALARKASPITYISKDDPPILDFHYLKSRDIPISQAEKLKKAIEETGPEGSLQNMIESPRFAREPEDLGTDKLVFGFFNTYLKAK